MIAIYANNHRYLHDNPIFDTFQIDDRTSDGASEKMVEVSLELDFIFNYTNFYHFNTLSRTSVLKSNI